MCTDAGGWKTKTFESADQEDASALRPTPTLEEPASVEKRLQRVLRCTIIFAAVLLAIESDLNGHRQCATRRCVAE